MWASTALGDEIRQLTLTDGPHGTRRQPEGGDPVGLSGSEPATCIPPAVGLGSTWSPDLAREIGEALGSEARAHGVDVLLGPGLNIKRSPLGGRNFEYLSEDPYVSGRMAGALVDGIQSKGVAATPKHFALNNQETDRMRYSAVVDEVTMRELYLRGFDGLVISDWGAVNNRAAAVAAGLDLEMPPSGTDSQIVDAVRDGRLSADTLELVRQRLAHLADRTVGRVAVIGPFAHTPRYQGGGSSRVVPTRLHTFLEEFTAAAGDRFEVAAADGFSDDAGGATLTALADEALATAAGASSRDIRFTGSIDTGGTNADLVAIAKHLPLIKIVPFPFGPSEEEIAQLVAAVEKQRQKLIDS